MFKTTARIIKKDLLQRGIYSFVLECDLIAKVAKPGQFVNIFIEGFTLRRPISICEIFENSFRIVFSVVGKGTSKMAKWEVGKNVDVVGPLGNGFKKIDSNEKLLIVGGGIGTPPLLELAKRSNYVKSILGFRNKDMVILEEDYKKQGATVVCTDDGSYGEKGNPVSYLKSHKVDFDYYYACGPLIMLKFLSEAFSNGELSLEARMGCGIGACMGCSIMLKDGSAKRICREGPVFKAEVLSL